MRAPALANAATAPVGEESSMLAQPTHLLSRAVWRDALVAWLGQRVLFLALTWLGRAFLVSRPAGSPALTPRAVALVWANWDGLIYSGLARQGYIHSWQAAFSPLFPALAHLAAPLTGGDTLLSALLIANLVCFGAFVLIRALAERELGVPAARRTLLYLAIFPVSFFLAAAYTESLFLLLSAGAFLALRAHRWPLAGLLVALAALTRPLGILLLAAVAAELWTSSPRLRHALAHRSTFLRVLRETAMSTVVQFCSAFILPVLALAGFDLYLAHRFGSLTASLDAEQGATWKHTLSWPWDPFVRAVSAVFHDDAAHVLHAGLDIGFTLLFLALAVAALRTLPLAYGFVTCAMIAFVLVTPTTGSDWFALASTSRYLLGALPAFFVLAQWGGWHKRIHSVIVVLSLLLLPVYTLAWVAGAFVA
jgi:hypothetical protein